ncbi:hypothetical protein [Bacillus sp. 2205SS5-2]|uniref:hypothetical protein n=1 Tax=Bacillus sp. 2205SS5-2 TaxID=3109031 RepID=UPI0030053668
MYTIRQYVVILIVSGFLLLVYLFFIKDKPIIANKDSNAEYISPEQFGADGYDLKDDSQAIQQAIDSSKDSTNGVVKLLGNREYLITSTIIVREGVSLELGLNTTVYLEGDTNGFMLEKDASIQNGTIEVVNPKFGSDVITIHGNGRHWSMNKTQINNVTLLNTSGNNKGTGLALYAEEAGDYISFMHIGRVKIIGFDKGILLQARKTKKDEYNWVNGNQFIDIVLEDCVNCIVIDGGTGYNEASGNDFRGLQIQISENTKNILTVTGTDNRFEGIIWDEHLLQHSSPVVKFTSDSARSYFYTNLDLDYIEDKGDNNYYSSPENDS